MKPFQEDNRFYACGTPITVKEDANGETHVYRTSDGIRLSDSDLKFGFVFGGGKDVTVESTDVCMESGFLCDLYGGGEGGCVERNINVTLTGGMIGRYLYGGGIKDKVGNIAMTVTGGAVKYGLFGGGNSLECGNICLNFDGVVSTNVRMGSRNPDVRITGDVSLKMSDGHILEIIAGGGTHLGDSFIEVTGGKIEKHIASKYDDNSKLHIKLYGNIFEPDGFGGEYPKLPEGADIEFTEKIEKTPVAELEGDDTAFFDTSDDEGKLVFRFFELRHPDMPRPLTPFPAFIGDSFLISFPDGSNMLVDAGMPYSRDEIIDGLIRLGVKKIDYHMITHAHTDHMGCSEAILDSFEVSEIWLPDTRETPLLPHEAPYFEMLSGILNKAEKCGTRIVRVGEGDIINVGTGDKTSEILILNPARGADASGDLNNTSIACKVTYKESSAMLCGDITDGQEKELAERYGKELKSDILKASHHGIVYQNYYTFIDAVNPDYIVVPSLRDRGVFLKTTEYSLKNVNKFDLDNNYVTGRWGKIKVVMNGESGSAKLFKQYK